MLHWNSEDVEWRRCNELQRLSSLNTKSLDSGIPHSFTAWTATFNVLDSKSRYLACVILKWCASSWVV
jgi:hypothetical protein